MESPNHCQRQDEQDTIRDDVEKGIGEIQFVLVDFLRRCDVGVPVRFDGNGQPDISYSSADSVSRVDTNEEPADCSEPLLYKDAMVEQHQGYP